MRQDGCNISITPELGRTAPREEAESASALLTTALPAVWRRVARDLDSPDGRFPGAGFGCCDRGGPHRPDGDADGPRALSQDVRARAARARCFPATCRSAERAWRHFRIPRQERQEGLQYEIADRRLAEAIARIKTLTGKRLLVFRDEAGGSAPHHRRDDQRLSGAEAAKAHVRRRRIFGPRMRVSALAAEELAALNPGSIDVSCAKRQMASRDAPGRRLPAQYAGDFAEKASYCALPVQVVQRRPAAIALGSKSSGGAAGLRQRRRRLGQGRAGCGQVRPAYPQDLLAFLDKGMIFR